MPDSTAELRFRAALWIARLVGREARDREQAFSLAERSYDARSKVVHGATAPRNLDEIVEHTRGLARLVLHHWVLEPPDEGVEGLDRALLA